MATWQRVIKPEAEPAKPAGPTGPRTPEGKARSSQNARKHGLTGREVFVRPDEQSEFDGFLQDYYAELDPHGVLEQAVTNQIIHASWNLRQLRILEAEALADLSEQNELRLDRLARYAKRFENTLLRCTRELRVLQSNRSARTALGEAVDTAAPLADPVHVERAKRTRWQGTADEIRARLGQTDLAYAAAVGQSPARATVHTLAQNHKPPAL